MRILHIRFTIQRMMGLVAIVGVFSAFVHRNELWLWRCQLALVELQKDSIQIGEVDSELAQLTEDVVSGPIASTRARHQFSERLKSIKGGVDRVVSRRELLWDTLDSTWGRQAAEKTLNGRDQRVRRMRAEYVALERVLNGSTEGVELPDPQKARQNTALKLRRLPGDRSFLVTLQSVKRNGSVSAVFCVVAYVVYAIIAIWALVFLAMTFLKRLINSVRSLETAMRLAAMQRGR